MNIHLILTGCSLQSVLFQTMNCTEKLELSKDGYIITDRNMKTSVEGVFAAGDICEKPLRQVVTAASDGAVAAYSAEKYVTQYNP